MTDNDQWIIQVSPKLPDGTLINIRGKDAFAFKDALNLVQEEAGNIATAISLLTGAQTVANAGLTGAPAPQQQAQAVQQYQQSAAQPQPQQAAPQQPQPPGPVCKHGPMVYKTGNGKRGVWKAYMCAAGSSAPDKCDPQWID